MGLRMLIVAVVAVAAVTLKAQPPLRMDALTLHGVSASAVTCDQAPRVIFPA